MKLLKNFQQPLPRNELKNILGGGMAFSAGRGTCISTYSCLTQLTVMEEWDNVLFGSVSSPIVLVMITLVARTRWISKSL